MLHVLEHAHVGHVVMPMMLAVRWGSMMHVLEHGHVGDVVMPILLVMGVGRDDDEGEIHWMIVKVVVAMMKVTTLEDHDDGNL